MTTPYKRFPDDVTAVTVTILINGVEYSESRTITWPARDYSAVKASIDTVFQELFSRCARYPQETEIESLRTFAVQHKELPFAHLCSAALQALQGDESEQWAIDRVMEAGLKIADAQAEASSQDAEDAIMLRVIRSTDTTRPDGATARKMSAPV